MPLSKIEDARALSDQDLADEILAAKRELFELRLQQATRRLEKPHQFKHLKHRIAQMMTVARERQVAAVADAKTPPPVSDSANGEESVSTTKATEVTPESSPSEAQEEE